MEFLAPDRRIKVRTFGTIESVQHMGAQPHYTVVSAKGTIYSFAEDCLRSRGPSDDNFALQGSTLVTIGDLSTTHTVLTLDSVDEAVEDVDEDFSGAEAGQASAEDAAAVAAEELSRAQSTVLMTSFREHACRSAMMPYRSNCAPSWKRWSASKSSRMNACSLRCPHNRMRSMRVSSSR